MAVNEKHFTFIWNIKNISFSFYKEQFYSPSFSVHEMGGTEWDLLLKNGKDDVSCRIRRLNDSGPDEFQLDYELSFLSADESVLLSQIFNKKEYKKSHIDSNSTLSVQKNKILKDNKDLFIFDDTLTVRCRMWDSKESIIQSRRCLAETQIETECRSFIGTVEKFSNTEANSKTLVCMKSSSPKTFFSSMSLCVTADGNLVIEMEPVNHDRLYKYKYKIFIRDVSENKMASGQGEFHDKEIQCVPLTISKEYLMQNKEYYLPNDVLTIESEVIFPTGKIKEKPENGSVCKDTHGIISNPKNTSLSSEENHIESFTTLKDDWLALYNEGILSDAKLKTATETFPVHKLVLSARSPVFKSMFTTDMREKTHNCVDIDDLDADTVRRMLKFMYSDTLDNLEYENAKRLYFAADKYNIVSLRLRCSNFLKQNLLQSNCSDVLLLAKKHQDKDLVNAVEDYIAKNDESVLFSDEWKDLEENHPRLTTEVFRFIYMKKLGN
ncbi:TD and POZ domain-containing protein 3 [Araneus ventricosus]|uniref:TD and POZ domain-containing protein 3 n=1 Tax=Araneus ventricosus TaxID=182803 RepID=A0A4Y2JH02_ARAVE|nr:TD and POZ domain-containing protein 3 [Araneus ventricosus]